MISVDDMPLSTVEKIGFKFLLKTLEPKYESPGRKKVKILNPKNLTTDLLNKDL